LRKIIPFIILISVLAVDVAATEICQQPASPDFGSTATSESAPAFVITELCPESSLKVRKPVRLTVRLSPAVSRPAIKPETLSAWTVLFPLDRADLDDAARQILNQVPPKTRVRVTGYTCPLGSKKHNFLLSQRRAATVANYLRSRGVTVRSVSGLGECCPVSPSDLSQDRRVLIEKEK